MSIVVRLKFEDGVFVPLTPIPMIQEDDVLEFKMPDPGIVYICETDQIAAIDRGEIVWLHADDMNDDGEGSSNA